VIDAANRFTGQFYEQWTCWRPAPHHRRRQPLHAPAERTCSIMIDEDTRRVPKSGIIGLEVEATGKLFARNIWRKKRQ